MNRCTPSPTETHKTKEAFASLGVIKDGNSKVNVGRHVGELKQGSKVPPPPGRMLSQKRNQKNYILPWPAWLSGLSSSLRIKGSLV